jgi:hypothetical protein
LRLSVYKHRSDIQFCSQTHPGAGTEHFRSDGPDRPSSNYDQLQAGGYRASIAADAQGGASDTSLWNNPAFQYDTAFLSRQILANAIIPQYNDLISMYSIENYSQAAINTTGQVHIGLLWGLESVLATNENFDLSV